MTIWHSTVKNLNESGHTTPTEERKERRKASKWKKWIEASIINGVTLQCFFFLHGDEGRRALHVQYSCGWTVWEWPSLNLLKPWRDKRAFFRFPPPSSRKQLGFSHISDLNSHLPSCLDVVPLGVVNAARHFRAGFQAPVGGESGNELVTGSGTALRRGMK